MEYCDIRMRLTDSFRAIKPSSRNEDGWSRMAAMRGKDRIRKILSAAIVSCALPVAAQAQVPCEGLPTDLLAMHAAPASATDRQWNVHFDSGAWHGFSLPPQGAGATGFVGPFSLFPDNGRWLGSAFASLKLIDASAGGDVTLGDDGAGGNACPGWLARHASAGDLTVEQMLFTPTDTRTLVRIVIRSSRARTLRLEVSGRNEFAERTEARDGRIVSAFSEGKGRFSVRMAGIKATARTGGSGDYVLAADEVIRLRPGVPMVLYLEADHLHDRQPDSAPLQKTARPDAQWAATKSRWQTYLARAGKLRPDLKADPGYRRIAAKAVQTLIGNWRAPRGDLLHAGVQPSYSNPGFNGFWAWDSWKHAVALARFAPDLAKDQMRAMFDYQDEHGMVADAIYADKAENNWRDTKPPLAAWAVSEIYRATGDRSFVKEIYPKLLRYHRWWYADRDHDGDGLAEYGSTDGTRIAAAWESGMDNAVRFDSAKMLRNRDGAWSLDQESVDLNAYLYAEKQFLAGLAPVAGRPKDSAPLLAEAAALKTLIRTSMFDAEAGYFFDISLAEGKPVRVFGPEGWIPLWAGVASPEQAKAVASVMLDPAHFATPFPFPTLDASHPQFSPVKGYWRGPVWMDQAWFAIVALERNGFEADADLMRRRLLDNAVGLKAQAPFYENYDPLTGNGYQSPNFSWAAAHYLLLLTQN
jgi:putative isomerase